MRRLPQTVVAFLMYTILKEKMFKKSKKGNTKNVTKVSADTVQLARTNFDNATVLTEQISHTPLAAFRQFK